MLLIKRFICFFTLLAISFTSSRAFSAGNDLSDVKAQVTRQHDEAIKRLQDWIGQVSIAAENRGYPEGADYMIKLLKDAGFQRAERIETDGKPGVFATLDAGAPKTVGLYFMYDVKQFDPKEWSSPPTEAAIVDRPGLGKIMIGRGAVNQKGPEATFLEALHAMKSAGRKMPVNFVFVAEGEEEIGSPHFGQVVHKPEVEQALSKCVGIFMPMASQDLSGMVTVTLGAKGVIEVELTSNGEKWGRGPLKDIHSSNKARVDSPVWHLVQALNTLVTPDGNEPAIEGLTKNVRPLTPAEKSMIAEAAKRLNESDAKEDHGREEMGPRHQLDGGAPAHGRRADRKHRGNYWRLHRSGRQDDFAAPGNRETRSASRSESDRGGRTGGVEGASRQAWLRRHRGEHDRWIRPHDDQTRRTGHQSRGSSLQGPRDRSGCPAAARWFLAGLRFHQSAAQSWRRPFWAWVTAVVRTRPTSIM